MPLSKNSESVFIFTQRKKGKTEWGTEKSTKGTRYTRVGKVLEQQPSNSLQPWITEHAKVKKPAV